MNELKTFILHRLLPTVITYRANKLPFFPKILSEQFCLIFGEREYYSDSSLKELYCDRSNFWTIIVWLYISLYGSFGSHISLWLKHWESNHNTYIQFEVNIKGRSIACLLLFMERL